MSELLNSGRVGFGQTTEDITKNWENSGLLHGLDGGIKIKTALIMEEAAKILLTTRKYSNTSYDVIVFPVIRRIISVIDKSDHVEKEGITSLLTADFILQKLNKIYDLTFNFFGELYIIEKNADVEAEAASFVAEHIANLFINTFKNKNIIKDGEDYIVVNKPI